MKRNFGIAALALVLSAGVASAENVNPGLQQIANYLRVNASEYTSVELHELLAARNSGDQSTFTYLLNHGDRAVSTDEVSQGKAQIAQQVGLDASQYTTAELIRVQEAKRRGDLQEVDFVVKHLNRNTFNFPVADTGRDS